MLCLIYFYFSLLAFLFCGCCCSCCCWWCCCCCCCCCCFFHFWGEPPKKVFSRSTLLVKQIISHHDIYKQILNNSNNSNQKKNLPSRGRSFSALMISRFLRQTQVAPSRYSGRWSLSSAQSSWCQTRCLLLKACAISMHDALTLSTSDKLGFRFTNIVVSWFDTANHTSTLLIVRIVFLPDEIFKVWHATSCQCSFCLVPPPPFWEAETVEKGQVNLSFLSISNHPWFLILGKYTYAALHLPFSFYFLTDPPKNRVRISQSLIPIDGEF